MIEGYRTAMQRTTVKRKTDARYVESPWIKRDEAAGKKKIS